MVQFEVVERQDAAGNVRAPESWETGTKDTVVAYPDEITRVKATFDHAGQFVWHCHILEHEDNENDAALFGWSGTDPGSLDSGFAQRKKML